MNRDRLTAALITLLISALIVVALCVITLGAAAVNTLVPENKDDDEILFTEVEIKQIPFKPVRAADNRPAASAAAEVSGTTDHDSGAGEESTPLVSAAEPSPATQERPKEEPKPAAKPQPKPDPQAEAAARIRDRIGKSTVTKADEGAGSSEKGNAPVGQTTGKTDGLGMDGRQRLNSPEPSITNATGRVTVRIVVNSAGHVTSATVTGTSGFGAREQEVRSACEEASRRLLYSPDNSRATQRGTITWIIK
ncbi:MAG: hypothetical protein K2L32_06855 [Muribaculaceae bacterium]|nr:hypothetical protein [Muribaculaceae bacterium]